MSVIRNPNQVYETRPPSTPETALRQARIVAFALLAGCVSFAAAVVLAVSAMSSRKGEGWAAPPAFEWIAWAGVLSCFLTSFVLPPLLRRARAAGNDSAAGAAFASTLVALALNEGGALLALALALASRRLAPFFYAAAVGFAGLLLHFPTRARFGQDLRDRDFSARI